MFQFVCIWSFGPNFSKLCAFCMCSVYGFSHYNCFCEVAAQGWHFVDTASLILLRTKLTYGFRLQVLYNSIWSQIPPFLSNTSWMEVLRIWNHIPFTLLLSIQCIVRRIHDFVASAAMSCNCQHCSLKCQRGYFHSLS